MSRICVLVLMCAVSTLSVNPERPRSPSGTSGPADCSGLIGFSAKGLGTVHRSGLAGYKKKLTNPGGGFFLETGEYNINCPGFYLVSFASYPQTPSIMYRLTLKKHSAKNTGWEDLVSTGPNGGANHVILQLEAADQIGVFFSNSPRESTDSSTFSAYRLTQK